MAAARNADWEQFIESHDDRYGVIVKGIAEGKAAAETAAGARAGFSRIYQLKYQLADDLRAFMGEHAIADAVRIPPWRGNILADREKTACRATRPRG
jgi:hypothetical protein